MNDLGIAVFTYRRPKHTRKVLECLRANHPEKLYIFQDGLRDEKDREDWERVSDLIRGVDFAETEIHISDKNQGCAKSIISGLAYVFSKHDMAIVIEDDICVSSQYLRFMRTCFEKYADNHTVATVVGGGCPIDPPESYRFDAFFMYAFSCIAWGTWKDRWKQFQVDYTVLPKILHDPDKRKILELQAPQVCAIMQDQVVGKCDSWAVFWSLMQIYNKWVSVWPVRYLAKSIGYDGVNTTHNVKPTTRFNTALHEENVREWNLPEQIEINEDMANQLRMVLNNPTAEERLNSHISITRKWIECLQKGCSFADYFSKRNIRSVYIYGASDIGQLIFEQIKNLVEVKGFLQHDTTRREVCGCKIYEFGDDLDLQNENILVTPVHDWDYIVYSVTKRFGSQNLIHLQRMLDELCRSKRLT